MAVFHTTSSLLAYEKGADGAFAQLQLTDKKDPLNIANMSSKHLKICSQRQAVEILFVFLPCVFFPAPLRLPCKH